VSILVVALRLEDLDGCQTRRLAGSEDIYSVNEQPQDEALAVSHGQRVWLNTFADE
jgi:hypothetical protein